MSSSFQNVDPHRRFAQFGLSAPLLQALEDAGYESPSALQTACLPPLLAGRDLVVRGHAGTGKTLAFALPLLEGLDLACRLPQILVLTPDDAMSVQVAELFLRLAKYLSGFHVLPIHGGDGQMVQLRQLARGVHVVVGTPRWVVGHVDNGRLDLAALRTLVIDAADELLRMDFQEDIETLLGLAPPVMQKAVFAADSMRRLDRFVRQYLPAAVTVALPAPHLALPPLRQRYWLVEPDHKLDALIRLIEIEAHFTAALVFVHTQLRATGLAQQLAARGYGATAVIGRTPRRQCATVVEQMGRGQLDILVATDTALQDIDLPRVSHLIHYDLPCDTASYQARLGHAAAVHSVVSLVIPAELRMLHSIEHGIGHAIEHLVLPERPRKR